MKKIKVEMCYYSGVYQALYKVDGDLYMSLANTIKGLKQDCQDVYDDVNEVNKLNTKKISKIKFKFRFKKIINDSKRSKRGI